MSSILTADQMFAFVGQIAFYGWLILIFLPRRFKSLFFIPQYLIPFGLGLLYAALILKYFFVEPGGFNSIASVRTLFSHNHLLLAGWIHYLAFDLFIGCWIARQSDAMGISRLIQAPILLTTFIFGPLGLALFLSMRATYNLPKETIDAC